MTTTELKDKLAAIGLQKYFDGLRPALRHTIRLYHAPADENDIPIGATKIGGRPDLPQTIEWPAETSINIIHEGRFLFFKSKKEHIVKESLSFIAQVNLQDVSPLDAELLLPDTGMLYFFYSADQDAWGFDPADRSKFKVIYFDGQPGQLKRKEFPDDLPAHARYKPCAVEAREEVSLPSYNHSAYQDLTEEEMDNLWEACDEGNVNKLLGYADVIQNEMELECELVTNGLYCGDSSGYDDAKAKALEPNAKNWRLLLQIDSNDENDMMWGDCGRIYFWIKKDDLFNKNFDNSWVILQCT